MLVRVVRLDNIMYSIRTRRRTHARLNHLVCRRRCPSVRNSHSLLLDGRGVKRH